MRILRRTAVRFIASGFAALVLGAASPGRPADPAFSAAWPWLSNMVEDHGYSVEETAAGLGVDVSTAQEWINRAGIKPGSPSFSPRDRAWVKVRPYPGGRHPRIGFLEGAIDPRRETKLSVFDPWSRKPAYAVLDLPEAVFAGNDLLFLAHTHIPTVWDAKSVAIPFKDWLGMAPQNKTDRPTTLRNEWTLPNGLAIQSIAKPSKDGMDFELSLVNKGSEPLKNLRVQLCLMLKGAPEFNAQTKDNKREFQNACVAGSPGGGRWVAVTCENSKTWQNPPVPCIHADPEWEICEPGQTVKARGRVIYIESADPAKEIEALRAKGRLFSSEAP